MSTVLFNLFAPYSFTEKLAIACNMTIGTFILNRFPDQETYCRIQTSVKNKKVVILADLSKPDAKIVPLLWFSECCKRTLGAKEVGLVSPYLPYMRQDKQFNVGEALTSHYFSRLMSTYFDWLVTVDPHCHRVDDLSAIYSIPSTLIHATVPIAHWIQANVPNPVIIGPDSESQQWVERVAELCQCDKIVLSKKRLSAEQVEITLPPMQRYLNTTPVLVDDIISTANTLIKATQLLCQQNFTAPYCIGVHGLFSGNAYALLQASGCQKIITSNTVKHESNAIDITECLIGPLLEYC